MADDIPIPVAVLNVKLNRSKLDGCGYKTESGSYRWRVVMWRKELREGEGEWVVDSGWEDYDPDGTHLCITIEDYWKYVDFHFNGREERKGGGFVGVSIRQEILMTKLEKHGSGDLVFDLTPI